MFVSSDDSASPAGDATRYRNDLEVFLTLLPPSAVLEITARYQYLWQNDTLVAAYIASTGRDYDGRVLDIGGCHAIGIAAREARA